MSGACTRCGCAHNECECDPGMLLTSAAFADILHTLAHAARVTATRRARTRAQNDAYASRVRTRKKGK